MLALLKELGSESLKKGFAESEKFDEDEVSGLSGSEGSDWGSRSEIGSESGIPKSKFSSDFDETGDAKNAEPLDVVRDRENSFTLRKPSFCISKLVLQDLS